MKKLIAIAFLALVSTQSFAAIIENAILDESGENIIIDVVYGGGCQKHDFKLELGACFETNPVQCEARLVDVSKKPDFCEALIHKKVSINLAEYGLNDDYYANGTLRILGDRDFESDRDSEATIVLSK